MLAGRVANAGRARLTRLRCLSCNNGLGWETPYAQMSGLGDTLKRHVLNGCPREGNGEADCYQIGRTVLPRRVERASMEANSVHRIINVEIGRPAIDDALNPGFERH